MFKYYVKSYYLIPAVLSCILCRINKTVFVDHYLTSVILFYLLVKNQSTFFVLHTYIDMIVKNGHRFPSEMQYLQNVRDKKKLILDAKKYRNLHDRDTLEFDTKLQIYI